jgi:hypothetical protein
VGIKIELKRSEAILLEGNIVDEVEMKIFRLVDNV